MFIHNFPGRSNQGLFCDIVCIQNFIQLIAHILYGRDLYEVTLMVLCLMVFVGFGTVANSLLANRAIPRRYSHERSNSMSSYSGSSVHVVAFTKVYGDSGSDGESIQV